MKGKTPKMLRSVMAMLLAVLMVAGSFGSVFAAEQKAIEDVTVGDVKNAVEDAINEVTKFIAEDGINEALCDIYEKIAAWAAEDGVEAYNKALEAIEEVKGIIYAEIENAKGKLEEADLEGVYATLLDKKAELEGKLAEVKAELEPKLEAAKKDLEAKLVAAEEAAGKMIDEITPVVEAKIDEVEAKIEEIKTAAPEVIAEIEAKLAAELEELEAKKAELVAKIAEAKAEVEAKIAEVEALKAQLKNEYSDEVAIALQAAEEALAVAQAAAEEVAGWVAPRLAEIDAKIAEVEAKTCAVIVASIETAIANVEAKIEEVKATIAALEAAAANVVTSLENLVADIEAAAAKLEALVNGKIEDLNNIDVEVLEAGVEAVIAEVKGSVEDVFAFYEIEGEKTKVLDLVNVSIAEVEELAGKACAKAEELVVCVEDEVAKIEASLETIATGIDVESVVEAVEAVDALVKKLASDIKAVPTTAIEGAMNVVNTAVAAIEAGINEIIEYIEGIFANAVEGEVYLDEYTYYVAIGDSYIDVETSYADLVAEELGIANSEVALAGFRAEDIRALLDANYEADAYGKELLAEVDAEEVKAEIAKADFITLSIGNDNFTAFIADQIDGTEPMDWERYVGKDGLAAVEAAKAEIINALTEEGLADYADMVAAFVESYAYAAIGFTFNYAEAINAIHAINPDAEVAVVGSYNPFDGLVVEGINIEEYVDYIVAVMDLQFYTYALLTDNTTFVPVHDTETILGVEGEANIIGIAQALFAGELAPSEAGHEYIKDQILGAVKFVERPEGPVLGDVDLDGKVTALDATQILRYANKKASVFSEAEGETLELLIWAGDVDGDGKITALDATQILRAANKKPSTLDK